MSHARTSWLERHSPMSPFKHVIVLVLLYRYMTHLSVCLWGREAELLSHSFVCLCSCEGFLPRRLFWLRRAGAAPQSRCPGLSLQQPLLYRVQAPDTRAPQPWLTGLLCGMWDPPRPGVKPMSLSLAGRFLSTGPLGKSQVCFFPPYGHRVISVIFVCFKKTYFYPSTF